MYRMIRFLVLFQLLMSEVFCAVLYNTEYQTTKNILSGKPNETSSIQKIHEKENFRNGKRNIFSERGLARSPFPFFHYFRGWVIKHAKSGLVLDAVNSIITLQVLTGHQSQAWYFEKGFCDKCYLIFNMQTGNVLDIQGGATSGAKLITFPERECCDSSTPNQQWKIHMAHYGQAAVITSGANDRLAMNVDLKKDYLGSHLIISTLHGEESQQFQLI